MEFPFAAEYRGEMNRLEMIRICNRNEMTTGHSARNLAALPKRAACILCSNRTAADVPVLSPPHGIRDYAPSGKRYLTASELLLSTEFPQFRKFCAIVQKIAGRILTWIPAPSANDFLHS